MQLVGFVRALCQGVEHGWIGIPSYFGCVDTGTHSIELQSGTQYHAQHHWILQKYNPQPSYILNIAPDHYGLNDNNGGHENNNKDGFILSSQVLVSKNYTRPSTIHFNDNDKRKPCRHSVPCSKCGKIYRKSMQAVRRVISSMITGFKIVEQETQCNAPVGYATQYMDHNGVRIGYLHSPFCACGNCVYVHNFVEGLSIFEVMFYVLISTFMTNVSVQ